MAAVTAMEEKNIMELLKNQKLALVKAMEMLKQDVEESETLPYDTGRLQDESTYLDYTQADKGVMAIVSDTEYAAKLYFHPEYNYDKKINNNAGGLWFQTYIDGTKREILYNGYAQTLKSLNEGSGK